MINKLVTLFFLSFCFCNLNAAINSDTAIVVNSVSHPLLFSIPSDYNEANEYPLVIGLHYCGGNENEYREALQILSDSLGYIVACPGYSSERVPNQDTTMFQTLVDTAQSIFNININEVYLTGMSCNGDFTLKYGLAEAYPFKGIFPWAPYISNASSTYFNYNTRMATVIAVGTDDYKLKSSLRVYDSLKNHNANVNLILEPNIGHTIDFTGFGNVMVNCLSYLNDTNSITLSLINDVALNNNKTKEIEFEAASNSNKELSFRVLSSHPNLIPIPEVQNSDTDNHYKFTIEPNNEIGDAVLVIEAYEKNGAAIEQTTFKVNVSSSVSVTGNTNVPNLKLFPVPVKNKLHISWVNSALYTIFDLNGKQLYKTKTESKELVIPVNFEPGMYIIKGHSTYGFRMQRFVVE